MQQQQKEFTESMGNFCQSFAKPMVELTKLNIETFNRFTRNSDLNTLMQAKKPEEMVAAQIKFLSNAGFETLKYLQSVSAIFMEAANEGSKMFSEAAKEAMKNQQETVKNASKGNYDKKNQDSK